MIFLSINTQKSKKASKKSQKPLTKGKRDDIIDKPHANGAFGEGAYRRKNFAASEKNFEKSLKKGLTKGKICGKIERSLNESKRRRSLKIEQQKFRTRTKRVKESR